MHKKKLLKHFQFIDDLNIDCIQLNIKNLSVIYRNYTSKINTKKIIEVKKFCKKNKISFYLSNNIKESIKLDLDGVYLPSFNKRPIIYKSALKKKFEIIGSAHNLKEIKEKKEQGCTSIFLSPIFKTLKSKKFLGINKFNLLKLNKKGNFVMLGGMNKSNLKKIKMLNINGVAGISFYKKKPAFN
tara:strand:+ start:54 stop:608 length:555 start_codon:yes stop_codon:yes gene_type:complete